MVANDTDVAIRASCIMHSGLICEREQSIYFLIAIL